MDSEYELENERADEIPLALLKMHQLAKRIKRTEYVLLLASLESCVCSIEDILELSDPSTYRGLIIDIGKALTEDQLESHLEPKYGKLLEKLTAVVSDCDQRVSVDF